MGFVKNEWVWVWLGLCMLGRVCVCVCVCVGFVTCVGAVCFSWRCLMSRSVVCKGVSGVCKK